jgi:hypothetical protein
LWWYVGRLLSRSRCGGTLDCYYCWIWAEGNIPTGLPRSFCGRGDLRGDERSRFAGGAGGRHAGLNSQRGGCFAYDYSSKRSEAIGIVGVIACFIDTNGAIRIGDTVGMLELVAPIGSFQMKVLVDLL